MMNAVKSPSILIFSAYIPPHTGGIERYIDNLAKELVQRNFIPIIVTTNYNNSSAVENVNGVQIFRLPIFSIFKNRYPIPKSQNLSKSILAKLEEYDIHAVIVNTRFHLTSHIGAKYGKRRNIPVYLIEHGSNYVTLDNKFIDFFANRYEDFLTKRIKPKITRFYGVSEACNIWLRDKLHITPSGVWRTAVNCDYPVTPQPHSGVNFLYAGRIIKQKGVQNILEAFTKLQSKHKNISLYIAGDGPELALYRKQYQDPCIHFLGQLNSDGLRKYHAVCDIFLNPPTWPEGSSTAILEAGLAQCAVIGTAQGGIKEIIKNRHNGLIVKPTASALACAMEQLLCDKKLRTKLARALSQTVQQEFSWQITVQKILQDLDLKPPEM